MRRIVGGRIASAVVVGVTLAAGMPLVTASASPAAVAPASSGPTVAATDAARRAGISPGPEILWESDAQQSTDYDAMVAAGATWTSLDVDWDHIQFDGPTEWRWNAATDRAVLSARGHGLEILGGLVDAPPWARRADCPPGRG